VAVAGNWSSCDRRCWGAAAMSSQYRRVSLIEAARISGVSVRAVMDGVRRGQIRHVLLGRRRATRTTLRLASRWHEAVSGIADEN
jgi:hypothetical protein